MGVMTAVAAVAAVTVGSRASMVGIVVIRVPILIMIAVAVAADLGRATGAGGVAAIASCHGLDLDVW